MGRAGRGRPGSARRRRARPAQPARRRRLGSTADAAPTGGDWQTGCHAARVDTYPHELSWADVDPATHPFDAAEVHDVVRTLAPPVPSSPRERRTARPGVGVGAGAGQSLAGGDEPGAGGLLRPVGVAAGRGRSTTAGRWRPGAACGIRSARRPRRTRSSPARSGNGGGGWRSWRSRSPAGTTTRPSPLGCGRRRPARPSGRSTCARCAPGGGKPRRLLAQPVAGGAQAVERALAAEHLERLEQRQPDGTAGDRHPYRRLRLAELEPALRADRLAASSFSGSAVPVRSASNAAMAASSRSAAPSFIALAHAASSTTGSARNRKSTFGTISASSAMRVCASGATAANAAGSKSSGRHGGDGDRRGAGQPRLARRR